MPALLGEDIHYGVISPNPTYGPELYQAFFRTGIERKHGCVDKGAAIVRHGRETINGSRLLMIAAGLSLAAIASIGLGLPPFGAPTIYSPLPALTVLPAFFLSEWGIGRAAVLIPVALFFAWLRDLLMHRSPKFPKRTVWLIAILSILTVLDFSIEWKYGVVYRGHQYTVILGIINALWLGLLWWIAIGTWRQPSFRTILLTHWLLFAWLSWYAFPYLGELP